MIGQTNVFVSTSHIYPFHLLLQSVLRDEHEYYGDTMRHWFILKRWGPSRNCASGPLKVSSGTARRRSIFGAPNWGCNVT